MFIVIEGIDGCGKDYQMDKLQKILSDRKDVTIASNVDSSSKIGKTIRELATKGSQDYVNNIQMAHLFIAGLYSISNRIRNKITRSSNNVVLCSRWYYSTIAYASTSFSGASRFLPLCRNFAIAPDLVIYLNIRPIEALKRINKRGNVPDVFESETKLTNAADIYNEYIFPIDKDNSVINENYVIIDAENSMGVVTDNIMEEINKYID